MIAKSKIHLKTAFPIANRVMELLSPHCEIIHIAGSIRRLEKLIGDIEIVCMPKTESVSLDLFTTKFQTIKPFDQAIEMMAEKINKGNSNGRYMQLLLKGGIQLDLFMPRPYDYYRQLAIRTGNSFYVQQVIASGWRKKGWVGVDGVGLRRECDCTKRRGFGKDIWEINRDVAFVEQPPVWASEEDFFNWLGVEWIPPRLRNTYSEYQYLAK